jgi:hypothetical protein
MARHQRHLELKADFTRQMQRLYDWRLHSCEFYFINLNNTMQEDAEMARYVALVFCWQWQYAITDAIQHKAVPMSINNLQGAVRTFGVPPLRCSNNDIHSTCTASSIDLGASTSTRNAAIAPYSSASTARAASSMFNINSITPRVSQPPSTVHAAQSFQHNSGRLLL